MADLVVRRKFIFYGLCLHLSVDKETKYANDQVSSTVKTSEWDVDLNYVVCFVNTTYKIIDSSFNRSRSSTNDCSTLRCDKKTAFRYVCDAPQILGNIAINSSLILILHNLLADKLYLIFRLLL